jgi:hypothetical protein
MNVVKRRDILVTIGCIVCLVTFLVTTLLDHQECLSQIRDANPNLTINSEGIIYAEDINGTKFNIVKKDGICVVGGIIWK